MVALARGRVLAYLGGRCVHMCGGGSCVCPLPHLTPPTLPTRIDTQQATELSDNPLEPDTEPDNLPPYLEESHHLLTSIGPVNEEDDEEDTDNSDEDEDYGPEVQDLALHAIPPAEPPLVLPPQQPQAIRPTNAGAPKRPRGRPRKDPPLAKPVGVPHNQQRTDFDTNHNTIEPFRVVS